MNIPERGRIPVTPFQNDVMGKLFGCRAKAVLTQMEGPAMI
jgi:hypothetical protein